MHGNFCVCLCKNLQKSQNQEEIKFHNKTESKLLQIGNGKWEQTFLKPYQKLTRKLQIAIDEMNTNFIVVLVQKLQLSKPRMKVKNNSITKNRKSKLL